MNQGFIPHEPSIYVATSKGQPLLSLFTPVVFSSIIFLEAFLASMISFCECDIFQVSINCEPFKYLQLAVPIDPNTSTTLSECLVKFTAPEKLDEDAMW